MAMTAPTTRALQVRTRVVTQTITRPFTTITALVTLGDAPSSLPTTDPPATAPTATPSSPTTDQVTPAPLSSSSSLTPQQLGAILGSVLGFFLLVLLICCFLSFRRRLQKEQQRSSQYYHYYEDDDDIISESDVVRVETRMRGTPAWHLHRGGRGTTAAGAGGTWTTVPPPVRFPPTPRYTGTAYAQTREAQIRGVRRYP
ncbi:hypothetical protein C8A01DRAFT_41095 [Parachaetomium inaequale]|uniref:Uncharacterized protein n=1 Tax=Parachaetomium inaequale TaxID=2588326 RepID=A0AAN6SM77_9PEZI|nr:hypothetical protein C8A01DRAFT_41095 [Parachaetomium inaequale]